MLSAISATRFAILDAMMAYADVTPLTGLSPATDAAFFWTGCAPLCGARDTPFGIGFLVCVAAGVYGFLIGALGADCFLATPLTCGAP